MRHSGISTRWTVISSIPEIWDLLKELLPKLLDIIDHHIRGTRFGIHCDPVDSLLVQGDPRYALTWMDAKLGDWVVTPRRGKAVEINALWYNALRLMEKWTQEENLSSSAIEIAKRADVTRDSFNQRFWNAETGHLYDVVDGENGKNDPACRPNQLFAYRYPIRYWIKRIGNPYFKISKTGC